jgi:hypothetical protein
VNDFIRTSGTFDAVLDFNAWLADPNMPTQLNPKYDSGDYLHPNEAGYQVLANNFDLAVHVNGMSGQKTIGHDEPKLESWKRIDNVNREYHDTHTQAVAAIPLYAISSAFRCLLTQSFAPE